MRNNNNFNRRYTQTTHRNVSDGQEIKVAIYGRVSTEHEAQISALENQMEWYRDQVAKHSNWTVYDTYVDPGISGTQMKKRPRFLQMIEDAKNGKFNLIFTRETCRFARNIEETLHVTRDLANYGVEVYFYFEDLWTFIERDMDRLVDYARRAQEESYRTSERVLSGQEISRKKHVLYGNGNILGYDLVEKSNKKHTYAINPEQSETVKMIYDLYLAGHGSPQIAKILTERKRKTNSGRVKWDATSVMRVIRNRTYAGKICYNKSRSNNYLEQRRINNLDMDTFEYADGDFPAIIPDEVWQKAQELRKSRVSLPADPDKPRHSKRDSSDVWVNKLKCTCGKSFRKNLWYRYKDGTASYGYQCYNQVNNGTKQKRVELGLDTDGFCDTGMVADWKMDFMAKEVFENVWANRNEAVRIALDLIKQFYKDEKENGTRAYTDALRKDLTKYRKRLDSLIEMRSDGEITKSEFISRRSTIDAEIQRIEDELSKRDSEPQQQSGVNLDAIKAVLDDFVDFSKAKINPDILEKFIEKVVPTSDTTFDWYLDLSGITKAKATLTADGRKNNAVINLEEIMEISSIYVRTHHSISVIIKNSSIYTLLHRLLSRMAGIKELPEVRKPNSHG